MSAPRLATRGPPRSFWLVASGQPDTAPSPRATILLWSSLSLYLGLFIGRIAQGQKIDEDDDTV